MEKEKGKPGEFCHDAYNSRMNAVSEGDYPGVAKGIGAAAFEKKWFS
jgi:hypothetical protein